MLSRIEPTGFRDETGYMFGRPIHDDEAILCPAKRLKAEMRSLLDLFVSE